MQRRKESMNFRGSVLISQRRRHGAGDSPARVSTGANAGRIWAARWARRFSMPAQNMAGLKQQPSAGSCESRPPASGISPPYLLASSRIAAT